MTTSIQPISTIGSQDTNTIGYIGLVTIVLIGVIPPTLLWQRERPEDMGLLPDGDVYKPPPRRAETTASRHAYTTRAERGWALRAALRTPTLWLLFTIRIFTPLGMMMVVPHHVAYLIGQGFSKPVAALAFGSLVIFSFTGRILFGLLSDRLGQITTIILTYSISITGTLLLLSLHDPGQIWLLWCHIAVYGLGFGARGPVTSALVTQLFHGKSLGAILGFLEIGSGLGGTLGPSLSGLLFDWTGSYTWSFSLSMIMLALAVVCAWLAGRQWRGDPSQFGSFNPGSTS